MKLEDAAIQIRAMAKQAQAILAVEESLEAALTAEGRVRAAVAAEAKPDRHWTLDVIPLFRHYFSQKASWSLVRIRFPAG